MSKGSVTISVRCGREVHQAITEALGKRAKVGGGIEAWTMTQFVMQAIVDKLNHQERSRRSRIKWELRREADHLPWMLVKKNAKAPLEQVDVSPVEPQQVEWTDEDTKHGAIANCHVDTEKFLDVPDEI